jgi:cytochrome bd-type quinol oxidase subunit 2
VNVPADHFTLMLLHALLIAVFFSFLWKPERRERVRYFWKVLAILVLGAVAVGWLMFPFPRP